MHSMRSTWRLDASTGSRGPPTTSALHHRSQRHSGDSRQNHRSAYSGTPAAGCRPGFIGAAANPDSDPDRECQPLT